MEAEGTPIDNQVTLARLFRLLAAASAERSVEAYIADRWDGTAYRVLDDLRAAIAAAATKQELRRGEVG